MALGAAGCTYVQLDDTNLAYLCDPKLREGARARGDDPDELPRRYAKLINAAIAGRPAGMTICTHLCRGNFRSAWVAEGGYEPVAEVLFNELGVDGYFLEYDDARSGDFAPLRFVPQNKIVVLGLVTTKVGELESKADAEAAHRRCLPGGPAGAALPVTAMRLLEHRPRQRNRPRLAIGQAQAHRRNGPGGVGVTPAQRVTRSDDQARRLASTFSDRAAGPRASPPNGQETSS